VTPQMYASSTGRRGLVVRPASLADVNAIVAIVNGYAREALMLYRSTEAVSLMIDSFLVITDEHGDVLACGALREYSPSLAEISSVAVARHARGGGIGATMLAALEKLARKRDIAEIFALTLVPQFFTSSGYSVTNRSAFPEKIRRDCLGCARRIRCEEICVHKSLFASRANRAA
jgi:N-acetylglutamate synthase-like GNAT family acetyltransferase